ncbi:RHS repeat-associated core domain-containing protein [Pseudomonas putida]|uniref:RHS repeat-associated core domain-containing protein n=1 Tax=Pseudomonas putida TaxID=303 RepID=UPI003D9780AC
MSTRSRKTILLATDLQSSVFKAIDANRFEPTTYTPYGHHPRDNGSLSQLRFSGELPDPLTGHYHLGKGYRQFNPVLMRFNSPDSWSPFGKGGLNAYTYCAGNPINQKDPTGHYLIAAKLFDDVFLNTYLLMKDANLRKIHLSDALNHTTALFGGKDKVKILANAKNTTPEAVVASALSRQNKPIHLNPIATGEDTLQYLHNADSHLRTLLNNRNINHELLNPKNPYYAQLSEYDLRILKLNQLNNTKELERSTSYLLTLRIDGASQTGGFNAKDFVEAAIKIRGE